MWNFLPSDGVAFGVHQFVGQPNNCYYFIRYCYIKFTHLNNKTHQIIFLLTDISQSADKTTYAIYCSF